ncbi:MAG: hypothetical protein JXA52_09730 [Planctomycetes bacterium]|nr:hypothetical protein [Planctomycetota bacterium]
MFKFRFLIRVIAIIVITGVLAAIQSKAMAGERGDRADRQRAGGRGMPGAMQGMPGMPGMPMPGGGLMAQQAEQQVENLKDEWRGKIIAAQPEAVEEVTAGQEMAEPAAEGAGEVPEGMVLLQKEEALILLAIENLEEQSDTIEAEAFASAPVAAAYQAAVAATATFYQTLENDPEYKKLIATSEEAEKRITEIRDEMRAARGGGGGNADRREQFEQMRGMMEEMNGLRENIQKTNTEILLLPGEKPELQKLQDQKTTTWLAFEEEMINSLKANEKYVEILKQLESLEKWQKNLHDTIEAGQMEIIRQNQAPAAGEAASAEEEAAPKADADPPSVF